MKVVWSEQARQEWATQYRFYFSRNPEAARRIRQAVMNGAKRLRTHPHMGRLGHMEGSRELAISGTPFLLVYDVNPVRVEILHVYDGRQDWQDKRPFRQRPLAWRPQRHQSRAARTGALGVVAPCGVCYNSSGAGMRLSPLAVNPLPPHV
jgi:toxin ParE1/3/4